MQIKKEIVPLFTLIVISVVLLTVAGFSKESSAACKLPAKTPTICCKKVEPKTSTDSFFSPWNLITEGLLHLAA